MVSRQLGVLELDQVAHEVPNPPPCAGDRAPSVDLTRRDGEAAKWAARLPDAQKLATLGKAFPVVRPTLLGGGGARGPRDACSHPFGALTARGGSQLEALGATLRARWLAQAHTDDGGCGPLGPAAVCHATDYRRTQQSAQFLLRGLLAAVHPDLGARGGGRGLHPHG